MEIDVRTIDLDTLLASPGRVRVSYDADILQLIEPRELIGFDIESGPIPLLDLAQAIPEYPPLQPFDEAAVKVGNLRDEKKIAEKISKARESHVADYLVGKLRHERDSLEKAALSPITGQVLAIGYGDLAGGRIVHGAAERELLAEFWAIYLVVARNGGRLAGWSIAQFDVPFLIRRSWYHGISVPKEVLKGGRFLDPAFIDLQLEWQCGQFKEFTRLDTVARFLGVGSKGEHGGGEFAGLWESDREKAVQYLVNDLDLTLGVARKLGHS